MRDGTKRHRRTTWGSFCLTSDYGPCTQGAARLWAGVFAQGLAPRRWVTLEVRGRRSGRALRFPLGMADWRGHWYLVSMLGEQCNWVCNVRAADGKAALRRRGAIPCQLVEVPPGERAPHSAPGS